MLALIAGTGALPPVLVQRLIETGTHFIVCEMAGFAPDVPADAPRIHFRLETLGTLLADLRLRGVTQICMAGVIKRPKIDPAAIDAATAPLVGRISAAMAKGDDGTLREFIAIFEEAGMAVVGAIDIKPDLLPPSGILTRHAPTADHLLEAVLGDEELANMTRADLGQACVISNGVVVEREDDAGTDAMLARTRASGGMLFKAPKLGQERRADLPTIGPQTAQGAAKAGLNGIVIEAEGVMVLDLAQVVGILDENHMFLWVRPRETT